MKLLVDEVPRIGVAALRASAVTPLQQEVELRLGLPDGGAPRTVTVKLAWAPMPHGGHRPAWVCPECGSLRRWLAVAHDRLVCRRDLGLVYRGQRDAKTAHFERVIRPLLSAARGRFSRHS